jgi:putative FmdB family regulatory protein
MKKPGLKRAAFWESFMPIYAYKCSSCGHADDVIQKMSAAPLTDCPACGKSTYSKQVTAAGFQLKGGGWYVTDFRSGNNAPTAKADGAAEGEKTEAKTDAKADAKPNATADANTNTKAETAPAATPAAAAPAAPAPAKPAPTPAATN